MRKLIKKTLFLLLWFNYEQTCNGQIHGLTCESDQPKLIVCQNGQVGTYLGGCSYTFNNNYVSPQYTYNCNGAVFTSTYQILPLPATSTSLPKITNLQNIKQAAVFNEISGSYNAALDNNGVLYTWGVNSKGQLGTGNTNSVTTPTPVLTNVKTIINIKSTFSNIDNDFMMVIKNDNSLWGWGSDLNGYLGTGTSGNIMPNPVQILTNVKKAVCSESTCIALKYDGTLWAWGKNTFSNLYCNTNYTQSILPPTKLDKLTNFIKDFDFYSNPSDLNLIAVDNNNNIFYEYQNNYYKSIKKLSFSNVGNVYCKNDGAYSSIVSYFIRTSNGDIYTFGNMSYYNGSLSTNEDTIPQKIILLSNIVEVYPSKLIYFLRNDGKLFVSGNYPNFSYEITSCGNTFNFKNACEVYLGCNILVGLPDNHTEESNVRIFPNPTNDYVQLEITATDRIEDVFISDISGKKTKLHPYQKEQVVICDIRDLSNGIYVLSIKTKNHQTINKKIIIEK